MQKRSRSGASRSMIAEATAERVHLSCSSRSKLLLDKLLSKSSNTRKSGRSAATAHERSPRPVPLRASACKTRGSASGAGNEIREETGLVINGQASALKAHGPPKECEESCVGSSSGADTFDGVMGGPDRPQEERGSPLQPQVGKKKKKAAHSLQELQQIVCRLRLEEGGPDEQAAAAAEACRLVKDDPLARITLAMLGAIPPLISMLDSPHPPTQCAALLALLNLAVGNETNKAAIVKGRAVPKMVKLLQSPHAEVQEAVVTAFLSLSALDKNKAEIGASGAVGRLLSFLQSGSDTGRKDALRAIYNLSIHAGNVAAIEEAGGVPLLLAMVEDVEMTAKALATLSNFAATEAGRRAIARHKEVAYAVLIDAMRWADMPKCQERAVYVMMMMSHHSNRQQRQAMTDAGAVEALLELTLLGTQLAQRRAARTLESFRQATWADWEAPRGREEASAAATAARGWPAAAALEGARLASTSRGSYHSAEKKVVERLARQSLHRTMQRIVRRASSSGSVSLHPLVAADRRSSRF